MVMVMVMVISLMDHNEDRFEDKTEHGDGGCGPDKSNFKRALVLVLCWDLGMFLTLGVGGWLGWGCGSWVLRWLGGIFNPKIYIAAFSCSYLELLFTSLLTL